MPNPLEILNTLNGVTMDLDAVQLQINQAQLFAKKYGAPPEFLIELEIAQIRVDAHRELTEMIKQDMANAN